MNNRTLAVMEWWDSLDPNNKAKWLTTIHENPAYHQYTWEILPEHIQDRFITIAETEWFIDEICKDRQITQLKASLADCQKRLGVWREVWPAIKENIWSIQLASIQDRLKAEGEVTDTTT